VITCMKTGGVSHITSHKGVLYMKNTIKKCFFVLVLTVLTTGVVFAQYAPAVADNKLFINAGVGFGPITSGYNLGVLPISGSVDYKLPIALPITVGASVTYTSWRYDFGSSSVYTYSNIGIGGRGMYHINLLDRLDTYAGVTLGYVMQSAKWKTGDTETSSTANPFFLYSAGVGGRYFFTNLIGAYLELSYSSLQYVSAGLTIKF